MTTTAPRPQMVLRGAMAHGLTRTTLSEMSHRPFDPWVGSTPEPANRCGPDSTWDVHLVAQSPGSLTWSGVDDLGHLVDGAACEDRVTAHQMRPFGHDPFGHRRLQASFTIRA